MWTQGDDFEIIVTRRGKETGHVFSLSMRSIAVLVVVFMAFSTLGLFTSLHYYEMWQLTNKHDALVAEAYDLKRSNEAFRLTAKHLSDQIASLQISAQKLSVEAGMDPDSMEGVGGPSSVNDPVFSLNERDLMKRFQSLDRKVITLESQMRQLQDYYRTRDILLAATPSLLPVRGYPSGRFGRRQDPFNGNSDFHPGIDISAPKGSKVVATADGVVVFAGRKAGYGKLVSVEHKLGVATRYGHLDSYTVRPGQRVKKGDLIGYVGSTGRATAPHVHYEVRLNSQPLNPLRFVQDSRY